MPAHAVAGLVVDGIGGNVVIAVGDPPPTHMHALLLPSHVQLTSAAHDVGSKCSEHEVPTTGGGVIGVGALGGLETSGWVGTPVEVGGLDTSGWVDTPAAVTIGPVGERR